MTSSWIGSTSGDDRLIHRGDAERAIARKLVESAKAGNVQAVKELLDRLVGKPAQAIHMVSEAATTVRVVLLDRTASPTHKMVEEIMRGELSADEPKQLEADEQKG